MPLYVFYDDCVNERKCRKMFYGLLFDSPGRLGSRTSHKCRSLNETVSADMLSISKKGLAWRNATCRVAEMER